MRTRLLASAALLIAAPALAEDGEIVVTGQPLPASIGESAYDVATVERDRIVATASGRIEDVLRDVAGLTQFRRSDARSANATSQGATLRGLGGNASSRALLVLDGVPQSDPFGGWITWPAYVPERLGSVRVTRGGGSGAYGSGALAGTIEMDSIGTGEGLTGSLAYGSRASVEGSALLSGKLGSGFGFVSASYARGDGFVPIVAGQRGPADIAAPYEQATLAARGVAPLDAQTELQASVLGFTDRRERGTILSQNGGDGADASLRLVHRGRWGVQALGYVQMRKFTSRAVAIDAARATVTQSVNQFNVPSTGLGGRLEVRPPLGEAVELRLGADVRRTTGETNEFFTYVAGKPTRLREAGGQSDTAGAFAELSAKVDALTLTGGVRADRWWIRDGRLVERTLATGATIRNELAPERQGWEPTARAGLAYDAGDVTLRAAAYLGWRLPTLNELYRPFRVGADATAANPALAPERMKGVELGVDVRPANGVSLRATAFTNKLTDAIGNVTRGQGPGTFPGVGFVAGAYRQRVNIDAVRSTGVELDARLVRGDWQLGASYAYTDARIIGAGLAAALHGLRPAQVPTHTASATLSWRGLSATARYVSAQFEDDSNSRRLNDALTLDAVAVLPVSDRLSLFVRGENVTDARVETAISATGIVERASPRTIWFGVRLRGAGI
ncbi:TonB-dependent receptor [Chakrabartia godavariana]|nr:TonB-dependent receptor [Chakrabartia godavariana]